MRDDQQRIAYKADHTSGGCRLKHSAKVLRVFSYSSLLVKVAVCVFVLTGFDAMITVAQAGPEQPSAGFKDDDSSRPGVRRYGPQYDERRYGPEADSRRYGPRSDALPDSRWRRPDAREPARNHVFPSESREPPERSDTGGGSERDT